MMMNIILWISQGIIWWDNTYKYVIIYNSLIMAIIWLNKYICCKENVILKLLENNCYSEWKNTNLSLIAKMWYMSDYVGGKMCIMPYLCVGQHWCLFYSCFLCFHSVMNALCAVYLVASLSKYNLLYVPVSTFSEG